MCNFEQSRHGVRGNTVACTAFLRGGHGLALAPADIRTLTIAFLLRMRQHSLWLGVGNLVPAHGWNIRPLSGVAPSFPAPISSSAEDKLGLNTLGGGVEALLAGSRFSESALTNTREASREKARC